MRKSYDANDYEQSGTTLSAEVVGPDGECEIMEIHTNRWEITGDEMGYLLRRLLGAMGFSETTIDEVFGHDSTVYDTMPVSPTYVDGDLAGRTPNSDEDELDTICPDPIPFIPYYEPSEKTVLAPANDPCSGCLTDCRDTACLHEEPFEEW